MLINLVRDNDPGEHRRLLLAGVVFIVANAMLVALSIAIYQKVFQPVVMVTLKAERAGLQIAQFGDVRMNGVLVGQVRGISQSGDEAEIKIGLQPSAAEKVPSNIDVTILPTTLFGQKFVNLIRPENPSDTPIADGDVIPSDRVDTSVELNKVLDRLFPLLRAVRPADLNTTLNALATALDGRGEQLGRTLVKLDAYLTDMNPYLPDLQADLKLLADVAADYELATPDLVRVLRNTTVTGRTVIDKQADLSSFLSNVTGVADTATGVLGTNEANLIRLGQVSRPTLALLDTYAPEYPCLLKGAARYAPRLAKVFEGNKVKQFIEVLTNQNEAYDRNDRPVYGEVGHGPWCAGLPYPPVPIGSYPIKDGSNTDSRPTNTPVPPGPGALTQLLPSSASSGYAGTAAEQKVVNALLATRSGTRADRIPPLATLLYGPIVRGTVVNG